MPEQDASMAPRSLAISSGSGSRGPAPRRGRARRRARASAMSPTRSSREPTAGCSTVRTRSGRSTRMSLDNQRNLKLAFARADVFMTAAEQVAGEMNAWAQGFFGRPIIQDWRPQLDFTTRIFRPRGLHLDDRHVRLGQRRIARRRPSSTSALYVVNNHARPAERGPKRRPVSAEDSDGRRGSAVERHA